MVNNESFKERNKAMTTIKKTQLSIFDINPNYDTNRPFLTVRQDYHVKVGYSKKSGLIVRSNAILGNVIDLYNLKTGKGWSELVYTKCKKKGYEHLWVLADSKTRELARTLRMREINGVFNISINFKPNLHSGNIKSVMAK